MSMLSRSDETRMKTNSGLAALPFETENPDEENLGPVPSEVPVAILIVDDNAQNLRVMESVLAADAYDIVSVQSGKDALKAVLHQDFALIFMDVKMPVMDGLETARIIRERERSRAIPMIFLTAYAEDDARAIFQGYSIGAVDYLVKPVAPEILRSKASVFADLHRKNQILKEQEQMLRVSRYRLEQRVQERTAELARVNEHLRESLREKDVLLKEIHHRVKNNLQIVSSILSLQSNYIHDEKFLQIFQESQSRIKSIALIHELLYEKGHLAQIDFGAYLHDLVNNIFRTLGGDPGNIAYTVEADSALMELSSAIHCGLIVNELVTNAIKYAFPKGQRGEVRVELKNQDNNECILSVSDNGMGLPAHLDLKTAKTMGLQLVDTLVSQIGAAVKVERNNGTKFTLRFPWLKAENSQ